MGRDDFGPSKPMHATTAPENNYHSTYSGISISIRFLNSEQITKTEAGERYDESQTQVRISNRIVFLTSSSAHTHVPV